ncbi:MAG TPA: hypothetical protein VGA35_15590 [bacterium]
MSKPLEQLYLASCPLCEYRELFSSEVQMVVVYAMHLCDHEDEALAPHPAQGPAVSGNTDRIEEHFQRLSAAPFN